MLDKDKLGVAKPQNISDSDRDAFDLKTYLMKSFPQRGLTDKKRVYNYRYCRARKISGNLFEIISNRWRVLGAPILLLPESVKNVVIVILLLHNYLHQKFIIWYLLSSWYY